MSGAVPAPSAAPRPLAIVAGGGPVPLIVANAAARAGRHVFIAGIFGEAGPEIAAFPHEVVKWGQYGRLMALFKEHGILDVVMVGTVVSRPELRDLKLDMGAVKLMAQMAGLLMRGDNDLLSGLIGILNERGFEVLGAHEVAPELVATVGQLGVHGPDKERLQDAKRAMRAARTIGEIDAGQAAVVINGLVVALEAYEGTDRMIERVTHLREIGRIRPKGRVGVLAKCAKPQQDLRVDMPTIGVRTVSLAAAAGLAGIAVEAGRVMIVDRPAVIELANKEGIFIVGRGKGTGDGKDGGGARGSGRGERRGRRGEGTKES
jgi:DUF1009 family protein